MSLKDVPSGVTIFLDTNVMVFHFSQQHPLSADCTALLEQAAKGEVQAITSTVVVAETLHRMMVVEAVEKRAFATAREAVEYLQNHPEFVKTLKKHLAVPSDLARMRVDIKPIDHVDLHGSKGFRRDYGFMTNDSLVLAVMKRHKVIHLATNDRDFDRVPGIQVWAPTP